MLELTRSRPGSNFRVCEQLLPARRIGSSIRQRRPGVRLVSSGDYLLVPVETELSLRNGKTGGTRQLALLYGQLSIDSAKASELVTKAHQAYPDDPEIAKTLGILNYRRGYCPQAGELLKTGKRTAQG
jgi:hypothetical protein